MRFRIENAGALTDQIHKAIHDAARRGLVSAAAWTVEVIVNEIIPHENPEPRDQGAYRAGWHFEPTPNGADVFNTAPHRAIIEWGARASNIKVGRAMIEALVEWLMRKNLVDKFIEHSSGNLERDARDAAWLIAGAMRKRGIFNRDGNEGLGILKKARERLPAIVAREVADEIREALRNL